MLCISEKVDLAELVRKAENAINDAIYHKNNREELARCLALMLLDKKTKECEIFGWTEWTTWVTWVTWASG